jgi:hypothetical protein
MPFESQGKPFGAPFETQGKRSKPFESLRSSQGKPALRKRPTPDFLNAQAALALGQGVGHRKNGTRNRA